MRYETSLPSVRLSNVTKEEMERALKKFNSKNIATLSLQDYRRYAYMFLNQTILLNKPLPKLSQM